jgi:dienelactone hydrolase
MYPDAGGVRDTFYDIAAQLADLGCAVLLPDVYYRHGHVPRLTSIRHSAFHPSGRG